MPLIKSASKKALKKNIETEIEAHPSKEKRAQDIAIAYNVQRQARRKKMADGGPTPTPTSQQNGSAISKGATMSQSEYDQWYKAHHKAEGGIISKDQFPVNPKKYPSIGDEYEHDNNPGTPGRKADDYRPAQSEYDSKQWAGEGHPNPLRDSYDAIKKEDYDGEDATGKQRFAKGGSVDSPENSAPEKYDYSRNPGTPARKPDDKRLNANDYMSNDWAGGADPERKPDNKRPPEKEYMAGDMQGYAEGGEVCSHCQGSGKYHTPMDSSDHVDEDEFEMPQASITEHILSRKRLAEGGSVEAVDDPFDHGEGISHFQEEGPGERRKYNQYARDYNAGDDRQISKQPTDSNEHGDTLADEDSHDMVDAIRKKLSLKKGK